MSDPHIVETVDPDEAFSMLSDPTRIAILHELSDADGEATFGELRDAVGMRDSGQFNYHLGKLTGRFVTKTDDGYELRPAGRYVVGSLLAGAYTKEGSVDSIPVEDSCPGCDAPMTFRYEDERVTIDCEECPLASQFEAPPGIFAGYELDAFPSVAARYAKALIEQSKRGFCPYCQGRVESAAVPATEAGSESSPDEYEDVPMARYDCGRCGMSLYADVGTAFVDHPAVVSFYHDRGIDVREASIWRFSALDGDRGRIHDRDPIRASVTYPADGDRLTLTIDESLNVVEVAD